MLMEIQNEKLLSVTASEKASRTVAQPLLTTSKLFVLSSLKKDDFI